MTIINREPMRYQSPISNLTKQNPQIRRFSKKNISRINESINKSVKKIFLEDICAICYEPDIQNNFIKTRCGHVFHTNCLQTWCNIKNSCPNCRQDSPINNYENLFIEENNNSASYIAESIQNLNNLFETFN